MGRNGIQSSELNAVEKKDVSHKIAWATFFLGYLNRPATVDGRNPAPVDR